MHARLEIVSAERIRDELDKLITVTHPSAGLWFAIETGLADEFLPELPAMRLEQDPIHRHKDVLTHTLAVVENVRRRQPTPTSTSAAPASPRCSTTSASRQPAAIQTGKGVTFHHHDAVGARMTRKRLEALRYPNDDIEAITELVALHLRFHTYQMGWTDSAVRRYVRDAGPLLHELNVLTRCDCTTRNERKAAMLSKRMDELEARIAELAEREELAAMRPELDGNAGDGAARHRAGSARRRALAHLLEIRLDEGLLGDAEIRRTARSLVGRPRRALIRSRRGRSARGGLMPWVTRLTPAGLGVRHRRTRRVGADAARRPSPSSSCTVHGSSRGERFAAVGAGDRRGVELGCSMVAALPHGRRPRWLLFGLGAFGWALGAAAVDRPDHAVRLHYLAVDCRRRSAGVPGRRDRRRRFAQPLARPTDARSSSWSTRWCWRLR